MTSPPLSAPPDLSPAGPKRQQRGIQLPQLLLSLLVVAVFALLAVWWQASTTSRSPVVALANDIEAGVPITSADLTEIYISSDVAPKVSNAAFSGDFVGTLPVADFEAGTFLTDDMVRSSRPLAPGQARVGLVLDGSRAPSDLKAGDRVQILAAADDDEVEILSPDAQVDWTEVDGSQLRVRLRLDVESAQQVQLRAASVVLIEVDSSGTASWEDRGEDEEPS